MLLPLTSSKRDEPLLPVAFGEREERSTDPLSKNRRLVSLGFTEGDDPSFSNCVIFAGGKEAEAKKKVSFCFVILFIETGGETVKRYFFSN